MIILPNTLGTEIYAKNTYKSDQGITLPSLIASVWRLQATLFWLLIKYILRDCELSSLPTAVSQKQECISSDCLWVPIISPPMNLALNLPSSSFTCNVHG